MNFKDTIVWKGWLNMFQFCCKCRGHKFILHRLSRFPLTLSSIISWFPCLIPHDLTNILRLFLVTSDFHIFMINWYGDPHTRRQISPVNFMNPPIESQFQHVNFPCQYYLLVTRFLCHTAVKRKPSINYQIEVI